MYVTIVTPDRTFSLGDGAPATHPHVSAATVRVGQIQADGRTDSEASSVSVSIQRVGGVEAFFFPPPVGASVSIYRSDTDALVVAGVLDRISIGDDINLSIKL